MTIKSTRKTKHYDIDAAGRSLGRLASEIATLLRGKRQVDYLPHLDPMVTVRVFNFGKVVLTGRKASQKIYYHYTGYHGGLKKLKYPEVTKKDFGRALKLAVLRMLNKNRLRAKLMKRLTIEK
ncbi:50S ribosomal protein L13 [Candidatus Azambacteria bacterium]|nr:50S ribosomal protein L13 [Candidatus Azambacteria bacterium]